MSNVNFDRRIRPPKEYGSLLNTLTDTKTGVFDSNAEALLFAAAVAFHRKKRKPLENTGEGIRIAVFENLRFGSTLMNTIAFAENKDGNIFKSESLHEYATIFEEYAYAGLEILENEVIKAPGDNLQNIISLIQSAKESTNGENNNILASFNLGL
jgi:dnd system-associated protein 4